VFLGPGRFELKVNKKACVNRDFLFLGLSATHYLCGFPGKKCIAPHLEKND